MLAASVQPFLDGSNHDLAELPKPPGIATDPIVAVMPAQFGRPVRPDLGQAPRVPNLLEPRRDLVTGAAELLAAGLPTPQEAPFATASGIVREAQKVERVRLAALPTGIFPLGPAETDRSGLFRVQRQTELRKAFAQQRLQFLGVLAVFHQADEIVGLAHQLAGPTPAWFDLSLPPQSQHLV